MLSSFNFVTSYHRTGQVKMGKCEGLDQAEKKEEDAAEVRGEDKGYGWRFESNGDDIEAEETEDMCRAGLKMLHEALDSIPLDEKKDYLYALEKVPGLVEKESPLLGFLRSTNWDAWAAAKRLVDYWKLRKDIFGASKAFLPITLTGALAGDIYFLEQARIMALPVDRQGRGTLFYDRCRCFQEHTPCANTIRSYWYILQCLVQQESVQKRGFLTIDNVRDLNFYKYFDRALHKKLHDVTSVMPAKWAGCHVCVTNELGSVVGGLTLPVLKRMMDQQKATRHILHHGSLPEVRKSFAMEGLDEAHFRCLFDEYARNDAYQAEWIQERRAAECRKDGRS